MQTSSGRLIFKRHTSFTDEYPLSHTDNLIQAFTNLCKQTIGQCPDRVWPGTAQTPIKRLGLVTEHIAGLPCSGLSHLGFLDLPDDHGKGIIGIVCSRSHRQPDNQRGFFIKNERREYQKRMNIPHFLPNLGVAVNPDNILAIRYPRGMFAG